MADKTHYREQLDSFFRNVADAAAESNEAAEIVLRDAGLDPDEVVRRGLVMIHRAQAKAKMEQEKASRSGLGDVVEEKLKKLISDAGSAMQALRQRFTEPTLSVQHRKLEDLDEEEAKRILREELTLRLSHEGNDDNSE